jgi:hypothetical protein
MSNNSNSNFVQRFLGQPLSWCWLFVFIWMTHVFATIIMQRWQGLAISLFGLLGALMVVGAIMSRRRKNLYPGPE